MGRLFGRRPVSNVTTRPVAVASVPRMDAGIQAVRDRMAVGSLTGRGLDPLLFRRGMHPTFDGELGRLQFPSAAAPGRGVDGARPTVGDQISVGSVQATLLAAERLEGRWA